MRYFSYALIYVGFYALIAGAIYFTGEWICLLGLLATPSIEHKIDDDKKATDTLD